MNILDVTYFWGNLRLQYATARSSEDGLAVTTAISKKESEIDLYISKYEKKCLREVFGKTLVRDFFAYLSSLDTEEGYIEIEGEPTASDWEAFKSIVYDTESKTSFVAPYIYLTISIDNVNTETMRGVVQEKIGKNKGVSNFTKLINVQNEFVEMAREAQHEVSKIEVFKKYVREFSLIRKSNRFWV